jgi:DNA-binding MarR family transcriptional regulator
MTNASCEEVLIGLRKILRAIAIQSRQLAQQYGITTPQLLVMRAIDRLGPLSIGALSREINLSQATTTAILDRLEHKHFVSRDRSSVDRRKVNVSTTPEGMQMLETAPSPIQEAFENSFSRLEEWEQTLMLSTVQRIAAMMNATDLSASPLLVEGVPLQE